MKVIDKELREAFNDLGKEIDDKLDKRIEDATERRRTMVGKGFKVTFKFFSIFICISLFLSVILGTFGESL